MKKINKFQIFFIFFTLSFYGQNDTISVIKHTDKDIIVNKESKIVYRGIPNSLSIEVPNCKSFTATAHGLTKSSNNLYNLNPGSGSEVVITIDIVLKNNKKKIEKHCFKIKNISNVLCSINGLSGTNGRLQKNNFKNAILRADCLDKNLNYNLSIKSFVISLPNGKNKEVFGNKITEETFEFINRSSSRNDIITISDIKIQSNSSFRGCIRPSPIQIQVL